MMASRGLPEVFGIEVWKHAMSKMHMSPALAAKTMLLASESVRA
jgi:hypothetical protein